MLDFYRYGSQSGTLLLDFDRYGSQSGTFFLNPVRYFFPFPVFLFTVILDDRVAVDRVNPKGARMKEARNGLFFDV